MKPRDPAVSITWILLAVFTPLYAYLARFVVPLRLPLSSIVSRHDLFLSSHWEQVHPERSEMANYALALAFATLAPLLAARLAPLFAAPIASHKTSGASARAAAWLRAGEAIAQFLVAAYALSIWTRAWGEGDGVFFPARVFVWGALISAVLGIWLWRGGVGLSPDQGESPRSVRISTLAGLGVIAVLLVPALISEPLLFSAAHAVQDHLTHVRGEFTAIQSGRNAYVDFFPLYQNLLESFGCFAR